MNPWINYWQMMKMPQFCVIETVSRLTHQKGNLKRQQEWPSNETLTQDIPLEKRSRRSETPTPFDFKEHCIFSGEICLMDIDEIYPDRWRRAVLCQTVLPGGEAKPFKDSILETWDMRNDAIARQVKLRVLGAVSDLPAADALYYKDCRDFYGTPFCPFGS